MKMLLLVSDANVLIDLELVDLTKELFQLPYHFIIPDVLFEEELKKQHSHLLDLGLELKVLESEYISEVFSLIDKYRKTSRNDLFALSLALQEKATLLTGDKALRAAAKTESVAYHGTIWLLCQMVEKDIVTLVRAEKALRKMVELGSRLPKTTIKEELKKMVV